MTAVADIRTAHADDADEISAVVVTTLRISNRADYAPEIVERVAAAFSPAAVLGMIGRRHVLVASECGRIVGTAALDAAELRSVFVLPDMQGRGIGAALMAEIVALAERGGRRRLSLRAPLTARGSYARLGFVAVGEATFGDERTVVMERELADALARPGEV